MSPTETDSDLPIAGEPNPRIREGEYVAYCYAIETGRSWGGRTDIYIRFRIEQPDGNDVQLFMACPKPMGKATSRNKYYQQWVIANGRVPVKGARLSRSAFLKKHFRVKVRDTKRKLGRTNKVVDVIQYSVVDTILERYTG